MPTPLLNEVENLQGSVATGGSLTGSIPPGDITLMTVWVKFERAAAAAGTEADIQGEVDRIKLKIRGWDAVDISGRAAVMLANRYRPGSIKNGWLPIRLWKPNAVLVADQINAGWGLLGESPVQVTVKFGTITNLVAVEVHFEVSRREDNRLDDYIAIVQDDRSEASADWHNHVMQVEDVGDRLVGYHIYDASLDIDELHVRQQVQGEGQRDYIPRGTPSTILAALAADRQREDETDWLSIEADRHGFFADAIPLGLGTLTVGYKFGTAPAGFDIVTQMIKRAPRRS